MNYRDIKANNTTPDIEIDKAPRATDSDMATLGPASLDTGDPTCIGVNIGVEDDENSDNANANTDTPKVHICGHTEKAKLPSILTETKSSLHGGCPSIHT